MSANELSENDVSHDSARHSAQPVSIDVRTHALVVIVGVAQKI